MPNTIDETEAAGKVGSRHNTQDQRSIQQIHDEALKLGAESPKPKGEVTEFALMEMAKTIPTEGNEIKAISQTETELRVGNYLVLFGGRDLTGIVHRANRNGTRGEYFSKNTNFESDYTQTGVLHVD